MGLPGQFFGVLLGSGYPMVKPWLEALQEWMSNIPEPFRGPAHSQTISN